MTSGTIENEELGYRATRSRLIASGKSRRTTAYVTLTMILSYLRIYTFLTTAAVPDRAFVDIYALQFCTTHDFET